MKTRYVVKGIGKEQTVASIVNIFVDPQGKISKVEDKWDGELPEGSIKNVSSLLQLLSPFWWIKYAESWAWWGWSFVWYTTPWRVRCLALYENALQWGMLIVPNMLTFVICRLSVVSTPLQSRR